MAEAVKSLNIRDWPREGLTLERAIELAIGPLKQLYAAYAARDDLQQSRVRRRVQTSRGELPHDSEHLLGAGIDYQRERHATIERFRKLLASGELVIAARSWNDSDAPHHRFHSDEARELSIEVGENSLRLYRSDGEKRLHALIWPKDIAPQPDDLRAKGTESSSPTEATAATSAKPVAQSDAGKVALKNLLEDVIEQIQFPGPEDRRHGWKKKWAAEAERVINERYRQDPKRVKPTTLRSVENRMNEFRLWPD